MIKYVSQPVKGEERDENWKPLIRNGIRSELRLFTSQIPSGFFVGRSRNYENKLQELYKSVVESLKQNARGF